MLTGASRGALGAVPVTLGHLGELRAVHAIGGITCIAKENIIGVVAYGQGVGCWVYGARGRWGVWNVGGMGRVGGGRCGMWAVWGAWGV